MLRMAYVIFSEQSIHNIAKKCDNKIREQKQNFFFCSKLQEENNSQTNWKKKNFLTYRKFWADIWW